LAYLRWVGVVPAVEVTRAEPSAEDELLGAFRHYLIDQRGLTPATVEGYAGYARACVRSWWPDGQIAVADLDAGDVITLVRSGVDSGRPPSLSLDHSSGPRSNGPSFVNRHSESITAP
jgi:hypothetical protein